MATTLAPAPPAPASYHVRTLVSADVQRQMLKEQARRMVETGEKVNLMDLAAEWLTEMARQSEMKV